MVECTVKRSHQCRAAAASRTTSFVIAAVEAACTDEFNAHGLLATTMPSGPVMIVNGPIRRALDMNSGINVFGQGNRANNTIGRALKLVIRNVGGGRPGEVDRATFGNPGKIAFCFAEDEEGSPGARSTRIRRRRWTNTVTLFPGEGPRSIVDHWRAIPSRWRAPRRVPPHTCTIPAGHAFDCILAVGPELRASSPRPNGASRD